MLSAACLLYPQKTDICSALAHVRFVPIADISKKVCQLFDQLVGASEIEHNRFEAGFIATSSI